MKAATVKMLKDELKHRSEEELLELCLRMARFKKENKELMTYLLFESHDEEEFIREFKREIDEDFEAINRKTYYFIKKGVRKILRNIKKHIRYSKKKETEVELLIYFCTKMKEMRPSKSNNKVLEGIYDRTIVFIKKRIGALHEDLQIDYEEELKLL